MTEIKYPNTGSLARSGLYAIIVIIAISAIFYAIHGLDAKAAAQWQLQTADVSGPFHKLAISPSAIVFVAYSAMDRNLYLMDFDSKKTIMVAKNISASTEPATSYGYVAWADRVNSKTSVKMIDRATNTSQDILETFSQIGALSLDRDVLVWREGNDGGIGATIKWYSYLTRESRVLSTGKWVTDPIAADGRVVWFETDASSGAPGLLYEPENAQWNLMVYDNRVKNVQTLKSKIITNAAPAFNGSDVAWIAKNSDGAFDVYRMTLSTGREERITNSALKEVRVALGNTQLAYEGVPQFGGAGRFIHVVDFGTRADTIMKWRGIDQKNIVASGNRVAWVEGSRLMLYSAQILSDSIDSDRDSMSSSAEAKYESDDLEKDTDGDGIPDTDEVILFHTNPAAFDSDGDGLNDYDESYVYHTHPKKFDTDKDGYHDGLEIKHGYSPLDPRPIKVKK